MVNGKIGKERFIKLCWIFFILILGLSLILELFFYPKPDSSLYFEKIRFFYAWFGFASCALLVLIAKFFGIFLKRSEDYYDKDD